jgi:hypothetical protein
MGNQIFKENNFRAFSIDSEIIYDNGKYYFF